MNEPDEQLIKEMVYQYLRGIGVAEDDEIPISVRAEVAGPVFTLRIGVGAAAALAMAMAHALAEGELHLDIGDKKPDVPQALL